MLNHRAGLHHWCVGLLSRNRTALRSSDLRMLEVALLILYKIILARMSVVLHHIILLLLLLLLLQLLLPHQLGLLLGSQLPLLLLLLLLLHLFALPLYLQHLLLLSSLLLELALLDRSPSFFFFLLALSLFVVLSYHLDSLEAREAERSSRRLIVACCSTSCRPCSGLDALVHNEHSTLSFGGLCIVGSHFRCSSLTFSGRRWFSGVKGIG